MRAAMRRLLWGISAGLPYYGIVVVGCIVFGSSPFWMRASALGLIIASHISGRYAQSRQVELGDEPYLVACRDAKCWGTWDILLFWAPDSAGYTGDINMAGRYTKAEAEQIEKGSHGEHKAIAESAALWKAVLAMRREDMPGGPFRPSDHALQMGKR